MPRNGSGSMAVTNSFTPSTTISSSKVNANFSDIADELTNSMALDGQSVMTAQLKVANGTVSAPGITFGSDLNSGWYRIGSDNIGAAVNGAKVLDIATTGLTITGTLSPSGQIVGAGGTASAPTYTYSGDLNSGHYAIGADNIGLAIGGSKVVDYSATGVTITGTFGLSSDFAINTNKFTVAGASGNTAIAGTLAVVGDVAVNTNKATIAGSSGNAAFAGTLAVTGASTLTGAVTANNSAGLTARNAAKAFATFTVSGTDVTSSASKRFNISSISRSSAGSYAVTFSTALPTANYIVVGVGIQGASAAIIVLASSRTTSGFTLEAASSNGQLVDPTTIDFVVFGY